MHPVLYIFLVGNTEEWTHEIIKHVKQVRSTDSAFFLHIPLAELINIRSIHQNINQTKTEILRNDTALRLEKIHVMLITQAHKTNINDELKTVISQVRVWFGEDFNVSVFTLCALLYELPDKYKGEMLSHENRFIATRAFLAEIKHLSLLFNHTFLLSDRNENGIIRPVHWSLIYEILARLPSIYTAPSRLFSWLEERRRIGEEPIFLSAGMSEPPPPAGEVLPFYTEAFIINCLQSVSAKPISIFQLRNSILDDAEKLLFDDRMEKAFTLFFMPDYTPTRKHAASFSNRITAWRVNAAIHQIARAYARQYNYFRRQNNFENRYHAQENTNKFCTDPTPPPIFLSLIRNDNLPEETFSQTQSSSQILRILSGFTPESLQLMNPIYT